jgi:uroporphyrinogen decarboxylase
MNSKQRVLTTLNHQKPDRVPLGFVGSNGVIDRKLKNHFGLAMDDNDGLLDALQVDLRYFIYPTYTGPKLFDDIKGLNIDPIFGCRTRWVQNESGGYWDFCDFPLKDADAQKIADWPMPNPDNFDYSEVDTFCKKHSQYCIVFGNPGMGDFLNSTGRLRTMEQVYVDIITDDPAGLLYFQRKAEMELKVMERVLERAKGKIDVVWTGEDLGTQNSPLISLEVYRKHLKPLHKKYVDLAKSYNLPVMVHTCGSSSWVYPDFIEMGIKIADTLQPEAKNMSPAYLKNTYGDKLSFHGCISTAGPLAYGNTDDVEKYIKQTLEIMKPGGGYIMAPTHMLQDNTPVENVIQAYKSTIKYGLY